MNPIRPTGCIVFLFILLSPFAKADGTYVKEGGGVVIPFENQEIALVSEEIHMKVLRKNLLTDDSQLQVTVNYHFKNTSNQKISLSMGFPAGIDHAEQYMQGEMRLKKWNVNPISEFSVSIDGAKTSTKRTAGVPNEKIIDMNYNFFYVWQMSFEPGQERAVTNTFHYNADSTIYEKSNTVKYVLSTGRLWKGPIEKLVFTFDFQDLGFVCEQQFCNREEIDQLSDLDADLPTAKEKLVIKSPLLANGTLTKTELGTDQARWTWENLEPTEDIEFSYNTALPIRRKFIEIIKELDLKKEPRERLELARNTLLALAGISFEDTKLAEMFGRKNWYVKDPHMDQKKLPKELSVLLKKIDSALKK